jgi:hypothetical protein
MLNEKCQCGATMKEQPGPITRPSFLTGITGPVLVHKLAERSYVCPRCGSASGDSLGKIEPGTAL